VSDPVTAQKQVLVQNERGLHARAATQFVQLAAKYPCEVQIAKDTTEVNGKSIMGVLMLVATKGTTLTIKAKGDKAVECVDALAALVNDKFGEVK
jgi:phosphocarrier protein